jgi:hypothetical protein
MIDIVEELRAIEEIRTLKARYWRGIDMKDATLLRSVFTDDAETDFRGSTNDPADAHLLQHDPNLFVAQALGALEGVNTAHHGHNPEISILTTTDATGIWVMEDHLWVNAAVSPLPFSALHGWGHYHDRYSLTASGWKISATRLVRLRVDTSPIA